MTYTPVVTDGTHESAPDDGLTRRTQVAAELWEAGDAIACSAIQTASPSSLVAGQQVTLQVDTSDTDLKWCGDQATPVDDYVWCQWDLGAAGSGWGDTVTFTAPNVPWDQPNLPLHVVVTADDAGQVGWGESGERDDEAVQRSYDFTVWPLLALQNVTVGINAPDDVWFDRTLAASAQPGYQVVGGGPGVIQDGDPVLTYTWSDNDSVTGAADYQWPFAQAGYHTLTCHLTAVLHFHTGVGASRIDYTARGEAWGSKQVRIKAYSAPQTVSCWLDAPSDQWVGWPFWAYLRQLDAPLDQDTQDALAAGLAVESRTIEWQLDGAADQPWIHQPDDLLSRCLYCPYGTEGHRWPVTVKVTVTVAAAPGVVAPPLSAETTETQWVSADCWSPGDGLQDDGGIVTPFEGYDVEPGEW